MRKKILINIFLLAVMAFATIALIGFIIWNKPHRNIKDAIAVETNAVDLYQALSRDSAKMKKLFLNKVVSVAGKIKQVQRNREGERVILLETGIPGASVNCTMEEKEDIGQARRQHRVKRNLYRIYQRRSGDWLARRRISHEVLCIILKQMKMNFLLAIVLLFVFQSATAQVYYTKNGNVTFFSKSPLQDIEADNNQVISVLNIKTGELQFSLLKQRLSFSKSQDGRRL